MRLSELFEDTSVEKERDFQAAWVAAQKALKASGIPPSRWGNIRADAHTNMSNLGQEVDDAISTAIDAERYAIQAKRSQANTQPTPTKTSDPKPARDRVKPTITRDNPDRIGKSGKKWGNQYYSDPAQAGGIKGAIARNRPGALVKRAVDKVDQEIGKALDVTNVASNLKSLNPRNRRNK